MTVRSSEKAHSFSQEHFAKAHTLWNSSAHFVKVPREIQRIGRVRPWNVIHVEQKHYPALRSGQPQQSPTKSQFSLRYSSYLSFAAAPRYYALRELPLS